MLPSFSLSSLVQRQNLKITTQFFISIKNTNRKKTADSSLGTSVFPVVRLRHDICALLHIKDHRGTEATAVAGF